jgi:cytochrome c2
LPITWLFEYQGYGAMNNAVFQKRFIFAGLALVFCLGAAVLGGMAMERFRPYPYRAALRLVSKGKLSADPAYLRSLQYSRDTGALSLDRDIDTGLLPLQLSGVRISEHFPIAKIAGSITSIGNTIVIMDRMGEFFACHADCSDLAKLPLPALPNNLEDFILHAGELHPDMFRAYSVKYLADAGSIAVSHEYFDKQVKQTRMAVSILGVNDALEPQGAWKTFMVGDFEPAGSNVRGGGALTPGGHNNIYLTIGDYIIDSINVAQDPASTFGKILEVDIRTGQTRVISRGHRNSQGLLRTRNGELFSTEHGPQGGDALDLVAEGSNYGWANFTLGSAYNKYSAGARHDGFDMPLFAWLPSIAPTNLIQIENFDERWNGDLLVGSLKARSLYRLRLDKGRVVYSEPIFIGQRIRDITQLENGTIALWTDDSQLMLLRVDRQKLGSGVRLPFHDELVASCMYCHHFGKTEEADFAPSLSNLFERKIASDNFRYSSALRQQEGSWTKEKLRKFLTDPETFASGTSMPQFNLTEAMIDDIIWDLEQISKRQDRDAGNAPATILNSPPAIH